MARSCPPGVFCVENAMVGYLLISVLAVAAVVYAAGNRGVQGPEKIVIRQEQPALYPRADASYSTGNSVLMNPYTPPLKDDRYILDSTGGDPRGVPINVSTRAVDTDYRQVGILTRVNGAETILPLMGRPLFTNRDKWQFYTMSDKNNSVKLPVTNAGKSCTGEYGCDNLYNGDTVYVEGYNDAFKVTMYDNAVMKYIPFV